MIDFAARKGLGATPSTSSPSDTAGDTAKHRARRTGIRGETYAYWYLRRHGYVLVARNFTSPGIKGEIDMVGYDGQTLAFVEVKTRTVVEPARALRSHRAWPSAAISPEAGSLCIGKNDRTTASTHGHRTNSFARAITSETAPLPLRRAGHLKLDPARSP